MLLLAAACGGDGKPADSDGDGLVEIERFDFDGRELAIEDWLKPTFGHDYPDVVTEINGTAITGADLLRQQVRLEMGRRQWSEEFADRFPEEFVELELRKVETADALEELIDEELLKQAAERLGYLPSYEEAVSYTREQERAFNEPLGTPPPEEDRAELLALLGWPPRNWADDPEVVETHRLGMGRGALRKAECQVTPATEQRTSAILGGYDCTDFLRQERQRAEIVYYVRWAD